MGRPPERRRRVPRPCRARRGRAGRRAAPDPVAEGNVGGGTGHGLHEFKGGIGTASRRLSTSAGGWTVGVLVQANYGRRGLLRIDGVPVGEAIGIERGAVPVRAARERTGRAANRSPGPGSGSSSDPVGTSREGSIIIVVATDAPILPNQCRRLAQRAGLGLARTGGFGATTSGDIFLCFATGNRGLQPPETAPAGAGLVPLRMLVDKALDPLFEATVEATEEAIVNALVAAETMTGRDGITAHALPHDRLRDGHGARGAPSPRCLAWRRRWVSEIEERWQRSSPGAGGSRSARACA